MQPPLPMLVRRAPEEVCIAFFRLAEIHIPHQIVVVVIRANMFPHDLRYASQLREVGRVQDRAFFCLPWRRRGKAETGDALVAALEKAGVEFIPENGGGAGVRMKKRKR
jgi:hypothetical protein